MSTHWKKYLTIIVFLLFFSAFNKNSPSEARVNYVAMLTGVYGRLDVTRLNDTLRGCTGMPLQVNDRLTTGSNGKAVILFFDKSEIKVGPKTELTIQEKVQKTGILVNLGKIFAKMTPGRARLNITAPHGAAAIEGTEFQVDVTKDSSNLIVASGKVRFYNNKFAILLNVSQQSTSNSMTAELTKEEYLRLNQLRRYWEEINSYDEAFRKVKSIVESIVNYKKSHAGAIPSDKINQLKECYNMIDSLVPDRSFERGHNSLKGAIDNYKNYCVLTDPRMAEPFREKADTQWNFAIDEYEYKYKPQLEKKINELTNP